MAHGWIVPPSELFCDLSNGGTIHPCAIGEYTNGKSRVMQIVHTSFCACLLVTVEFDPYERNVAALKIVPNFVSRSRSGSSNDSYVGRLCRVKGFVCHSAPFQLQILITKQERHQ